MDNSHNIMPKIRQPAFIMLLFSPSIVYAAPSLEANTSKPIEGQPPLVSFDNGKTFSRDLSKIFALTLPDNQLITPDAADELVRIDGNQPFTQVKTLVQADGISRNLSDLVPHLLQYSDPDNDEAGGIDNKGFNGTLTALWRDSAGIILTADEVTQKPDTCRQPFNLTLVAKDAAIVSKYGIPNKVDFGDKVKTYPITIDNVQPIICFAKPDLLPNNSVDGYPNKMVWDPDRGFLVQSKTDASKNFPATGFDGAKFDLLVMNMDVENSIWSASVDGDNLQVVLTPKANRVEVELKDPLSGFSGKFKPTTITISNPDYGLSYAFRINKWYRFKGKDKDGVLKSANEIGYFETPARCREFNPDNNWGVIDKQIINYPYGLKHQWPYLMPRAPATSNYGGNVATEWGLSLNKALNITDDETLILSTNRLEDIEGVYLHSSIFISKYGIEKSVYDRDIRQTNLYRGCESY